MQLTDEDIDDELGFSSGGKTILKRLLKTFSELYHSRLTVGGIKTVTITFKRKHVAILFNRKQELNRSDKWCD